MKTTRFMQAMFSNTDEELAKQVDNDIQSAKKSGVVDTEEVEYRDLGDGNVAITDKENGEVTLAQKATDEADTYDLVAVPDGQLEKFLHPSEEGRPGNQIGADDEKVENHVGCNRIGCEEEKEFSVSTDNSVVLRIFSDQEYCERLFSEVIESEETAKVGDLKVEKLDDEENTVVVTNETTGDQAKVTLDNDEMEVTELDSKNFSDYMPLFVIGVQPFDHIIVDAQAYTEEDANELLRRLEEDGIQAVEIFDNQEEARNYAMQLLKGLGADPVNGEGEIEEPVEQKEYSEGASVYVTRFYSNNNEMMCKLFSESAEGISHTQDIVEESIKSGDSVEFEDGVVTPVDPQNAIIEDVNGDYTLVSLQGEDMLMENMEPEAAKAVLNGEDIMTVEAEKEYSDVYCNEAETKFFSTNEPMTSYMERLFSEEADQDDIEEAIESGKVVETDNEIITPLCPVSAVIEDKENGEFTKAILDEGTMDVTPLTEEEAEELIENSEEGNEDEKEFSNIYCDKSETRFFSDNEPFNAFMERMFSDVSSQEAVEEAIESGEAVETESEIITPIDSETAIVEDKGNGEFTKVTAVDDESLNVHPISEEEAGTMVEEKEYSDVYCNEAETKFFSTNEPMTSYMERLFSEEADQDDVEKAIESGNLVETENELITPISEDVAVIEDKENGEFTKAIIDDKVMDVTPLTEEEASALIDEVEEEKEEDKEQKEEDEEKKKDTLNKFFSDNIIPATQPNTVQAPAQAQADPNAQPVVEEQPATVENIEDKALAAVESIKAAADEASAQILEAKATPAPETEPEVVEAQFSKKTFSANDTLVSWLGNK